MDTLLCTEQECHVETLFYSSPTCFYVGRGAAVVLICCLQDSTFCGFVAWEVSAHHTRVGVPQTIFPGSSARGRAARLMCTCLCVV